MSDLKPGAGWESILPEFIEADSSAIESSLANFVGDVSREQRVSWHNSIKWLKHASKNPVLNVGPSGSWDEKWVEVPRVIFDGSRYHMWYHGVDSKDTRRTGYATSE